MSAADISLREAIALLEGHAASIVNAIFDGKCIPWIGSGISCDKLPGVPELLHELLVILFEKSDSSNATCPFRRQFEEIVGLSSSPKVDLAVHPDNWPESDRKLLLADLTTKYSIILEQSVCDNGKPLSIRWDLLKLPEKYSDPSITPDAEHQLLCLLVAEGVFKNLVTTNWDPLIERADRQCTTNGSLRVHPIACTDELDTSQTTAIAHLYKIHGCAQKTVDDFQRYQRFMIATQLEIQRWISEEAYAPFREAIRTMLRQCSVLCIGLSAQDINLQLQILSATLGRSSFDPTFPRLAFTATTLWPSQKTILRGLYGEPEFAAKESEICGRALLPIYGKPLLGSLAVLLLLRKVECLVNLAAGELGPTLFPFALRMVTALRERVLSHYDSIHVRTSPNDTWCRLVEDICSVVARFVFCYRNHARPLSSLAYEPLHRGALVELNADPRVLQLGDHWAILSIALFAFGHDANDWTFNFGSSATASSASPFSLTVNGTERHLYFASDPRNGRAKLDGPSNALSNNSIVVYPNGSRPFSNPRGPQRRLPSRTSRPAQPKEIWMRDLIELSNSELELRDLVKAELV